MVNFPTAVAEPTDVHELAYPTELDSLTAVAGWLNTALDRVEDGAAPGGLIIRITAGTPAGRSADVAEWTRWEKAVSRIERHAVV